MNQPQSRGAASARDAASSRGTSLALLDTPKAVDGFLQRMQAQMNAALPSQLKPERMARLVLTAFGTNPKLFQCDPTTIAGSVMNACQLGLEPNVNGQGFLVPYFNTKRGIMECQFIPGWKGLVDLANRSGRCVVWTGAAFAGDEFDYSLGSDPFVRHRPCGEDDPKKLTHVYAVGKIKGMEHVPVIFVYEIKTVWAHRDRYNKVGNAHYSFKEPEAYARKIPLLQVLKYMPQTVELTAAMAVSAAAEASKRVTIDATTWVPVTDPDADDGQGDDGGGFPADTGGQGQQASGAAAGAQQQQSDAGNGKRALSDEELQKKRPSIEKALKAGEQVNQLITALKTRNSLTRDQEMEIASWVEASAHATT